MFFSQFQPKFRPANGAFIVLVRLHLRTMHVVSPCLVGWSLEIWLLQHFRFYLTINVQSWTDLAQNVHLVISNQTVQLVFFSSTFNDLCTYRKIRCDGYCNTFWQTFWEQNTAWHPLLDRRLRGLLRSSWPGPVARPLPVLKEAEADNHSYFVLVLATTGQD